MKPKRNAVAKSSRRVAVLSFVLFGLVALAIVVALEFLDFQAGRYSFIFSRIVRLQPKASAGERFSRDLIALLDGQKVPHDAFRDSQGIVHFKIDLAEPLYLPLTGELRRLVRKHGGIDLLSEVQGMKDQVIYLYQVRFGQRLTHLILLSKKLALPPTAQPAASPPARTGPGGKAPLLAIIIDDIGYADLVADQLRDLGIPLTGAVIPSAPYARSEAQRLHQYGLEEIIHMPMQPKDPANHHPRGEFILADSGDAEIQELLQQAQAAVPFARGMNNHMGSLLTSDPRAMRRVLEQVKERGLFFVDSKTTSDTLAYDLARKMKIRTAQRNVFLDDVQTYEYSRGQIRRLVELARQNGHALAIGHPFPSTLAALRDSIPWLKQQKVSIVPVSEILE
jgi:polysaccharide deacetylase 2 family uncharacterized protein YibQ